MGGPFTQILAVLGILQFVLQGDDHTVKVTVELVRQHEEQHRQEMTWLQEMGQRSQEHTNAQESLLLLACHHWWFWISAEILLMLFAFYWLPRQGSAGYNSSGYGETPAVKRRKRTRRRWRKRMRGIADYGDKLDQIRSPDLYFEWKDVQKLEEKMPSPSRKKLRDKAAPREYTSIHSQSVCFCLPKTRSYFRWLRIFHVKYKV